MYRCTNCSFDYRFPAGECPQCGKRGTLLKDSRESLVQRSKPVKASLLASEKQISLISTGVPVFDEALSGGFSPRFSVSLAGGEGGGKSTLAAQICAASGKY